MKVAINGAGVAGPTLAWWLRRHGHEPVLIEAAPRLRAGGYIVDFWGAGFEIAARMGLTPSIVAAGYRVDEVRIVGDDGRRIAGFGGDLVRDALSGRYTSLPRSELAALIHASLEDVETVFDDSIEAIEPAGDKLRVGFRRSRPREFDLVVGADGLHSRVREIAFGPERDFEKYLGYGVAAFEAPGYRPRDGLAYVSRTRPGRQIARFALRGDSTLIFMIWRDDSPARDVASGDAARRAALGRRFGDFGWENAAVLDALNRAETVYVDRVSQIRMPRWTTGRVALVGDAAAAVSLLAGEGTGVAMTEAYVLAGEIRRAEGDLPRAFAAYETRLRRLLANKQRAAVGFAKWFAPASRFGVALRNLAMRAMAVPAIGRRVLRGAFDDDLDLPHYE